MAKKTLNEATIRRFQKLAKVAPINEMYHGLRDEEEKMEETVDALNEEEGEEETELAPIDDADPMAAEEGGDDLELTDEEADVIIELGKKLEAAMSGEEAEEGAVDADPMAPEADAIDTEEEGEEDIMEALAGISYVPSQAEIVNEVAQRVAKRLKAAKLHEAKLNKALGRK